MAAISRPYRKRPAIKSLTCEAGRRRGANGIFTRAGNTYGILGTVLAAIIVTIGEASYLRCRHDTIIVINTGGTRDTRVFDA